MNKFFADTSYFLALLNRCDEWHAKALELSAQIDRLVTTEWVLIELADGIASSRRREMFLRTREELLIDNQAQVIWFERSLHEHAIQLFNNRADKKWSLTDCTSFVVMQRESMTQALTADHHFEQAGFVALLR